MIQRLLNIYVQPGVFISVIFITISELIRNGRKEFLLKTEEDIVQEAGGINLVGITVFLLSGLIWLLLIYLIYPNPYP